MRYVFLVHCPINLRGKGCERSGTVHLRHVDIDHVNVNNTGGIQIQCKSHYKIHFSMSFRHVDYNFSVNVIHIAIC